MKDITPKEYACTVSASCPAVIEDGEDLIIVSAYPVAWASEYPEKIGSEESAVRIKRDLVIKALEGDR